MNKYFTQFRWLAATLMLVAAMVMPSTAWADDVTFTVTEGTAGFDGESFDKLIDGKYTSDDGTKWCLTFPSEGAYIIFSASEAIQVTGYSIVTGNDNASNSGRNPKSWKFYGCNDASAGRESQSWVLIDQKDDDTVLQDVNYQKYDFTSLSNPSWVKYQYFKLEITATQGSNVMQMSEFILDYSTCEHQWEKTGETIDPTCTEGGYNVEKCSLCQATRNVANGTSAKGHEWVSGDTVAPTCTEHGYTPQTCSGCGAKQETDIKDALGHDFVNDGPCSRCGIMNTVPSKPAGEGTEISPYKISTVGELYWFAGLVNGDESVCTGGVTQNKSANAVLTADIIVNRDLLTSLKYDSDNNVTNGSDFTSWTSIGWARWVGNVFVENPYTGTFDGQGHTVSGLYFNDTNEDYVGLFGYVGSGGSVSNVGIVDSYFNGKQCVGGVCGENQGTITNCYNTGTVTGTGDYVGGVCGRNIGTITSCYNTGTVTGTGYCVGGVCGDNYSENNGTATITNCYNIGKVSGSSSVGGVCGRIDGTITNCYNTGAVSASGNNPKVGGVCGYLWSGNIINCYYDKDKCNVKGMTNDSGTIDVTGQAEGKTTEQFAGGEVAYLLAQGCTINEISYSGSVWGQTIGTDNYPVLGGAKVYENTPSCSSESGEKAYSNIQYSESPEHNYINGICTVCGAYQPATQNASGVYEIGNAGQLYWFAGLVNGDASVCDYDEDTNPNGIQQNTSANAILTADIVVNRGLEEGKTMLESLQYDESGDVTNGTEFRIWTPIGNFSNIYTGTFDGKGYKISGLYFNNTSENNVGLFGYVQNSTIKNVGIVDSYFKGHYYVGGVCGYNVADSEAGTVTATITNCYNTGSVSGNMCIGGVCGRNNSGTITNCYNTGLVSGSYNVGGVCGYNDTGSITNCNNTGSVSGNAIRGGVCGYNSGTITKCYNTGSVSGTGANSQVGGVCGYNETGSITNCYNTGSFSSDKGAVGGVCGSNERGTITNCYNRGEVTGTENVGGVCGQNLNGSIINCYYLAAISTEDGGKTTDEFKSGEVAYLLQGSQEEAVWGQTLSGTGKQDYPVLGGIPVYYRNEAYTNIGILTEGTQKITASSSPLIWYEFTPTATGTYQFSSTMTAGNLYVNTTMTADDYKEITNSLNYELTAGTTYYVAVSAEPGSYDLTITRLGTTTALDAVASPQIYAVDGRIVCAGECCIYDLLGRDVTRLNGSLHGVYVVKVGEAAVKVVVK
ncbi:MAG: GLUG motif-containing protein [Paludibacteraceae bacterium]